MDVGDEEQMNNNNGALDFKWAEGRRRQAYKPEL